jgi:BASS family bile acid:Na+ symporter
LEAIDQAPFNFDPRIGLLLGIMVGFLVFAVALDLTWEQLRRVLKLRASTGGSGLDMEECLVTRAVFFFALG